MPSVITTCQKCSFQFEWYMSEGQDMPNCPKCDFNPNTSRKNIKTDRLLANLKDSNKRNNVALELADKGKKSAIEPLLEILETNGAKTSSGVLMALGELKAEEAVDMILKFMPENDSVDDTRGFLHWGTRALAEIGTENALKNVLRTIHHVMKDQIHIIMKSYVKLGEKAVPILLERFIKWETEVSFTDIKLRSEFIWALGEIGDERALEPLKNLVSERKALRINKGMKRIERRASGDNSKSIAETLREAIVTISEQQR